MANLFLGTICGGKNQITIDEGSLTLSIGDVCSVTDGVGNVYCVQITDGTQGLATYTAQTIYASCESCAISNSLNLIAVGCESPTKYIIPLISPFPSYGDVFYLTLEERGKQFSVCAFITDSTPQAISHSLISSTSYINCLGCSISANSTTFLVEQCFTGTQYYVLLPVDVNTGRIISFNPINSLDQLCGEIVQEEPGTPPTAIYLTDFKGCDECLDQLSVRRIIESCIDGTQQVVFGSALYNINESSFLTINDPAEGFSGCYRIGDVTSDPVTVTGYLSYSPSPSCEECVSCNGFEFEYFVCGEPGLTGETFSLQYIESGQTFYHPISGCCEVSQITTAGTYNEIFTSFYEYNTCEECTGSTIGYETWVANYCSGGEVIVTTPSGFSIGDILTLNSGILTKDCVELISPYTSEPITEFGKTTETIYPDCTTCNNNTYVAYPFVNCLTSGVQYYTINLTDFESITNYGIVRDGSYNCYYIINGCATPTYPTISGVYFRTCIECTSPLSAGTESTVCVICCPCTSGETVTSVIPPHPQWTNQQGKTISLLDAITLGGPNGLNN